jgi:membrane-associated protein
MIAEFFQALYALDIAQLVNVYGNWIFAILFLIIFAETGLVIFPFLPGDSLLFVAGAVCATMGLQVHLLAGLLFIAGILGNAVNYSIGRYVGPKVFARAGTTGLWRLVRKSHLDKTHEFFERHGGVALIIGRFVPIVRTFVPFLAGVGQMTYAKFMAFNVIGSLAWIGLLTYAGYLFGNVPVVKNNLGLVVVGIVIVSVLPMVIEVLKEWRRSRRAASLKRDGQG